MTDHDDTPSTEPDYSDRFCIEQEDDGHRYHVLSFGGETHYETRREAIEAAREYGNTAELERLAARVASAEAEVERLKADDIARRNAYSELADTNERLRTELAKLRAAAAPVELSEGWAWEEERLSNAKEDDRDSSWKQKIDALEAWYRKGE